MVQRIASIGTDCLAMTKAGIEHQNGGWGSVHGKYFKHRSLILVPEMEEAVPSQYPLKSPTKGQRSHIADDPFLIRHPSLAQRYEGRRAVHAGDVKTMRNHVKRNGGAATTAKIENCIIRRHVLLKKIVHENVPDFFAVCQSAGEAFFVNVLQLSRALSTHRLR